MSGGADKADKKDEPVNANLNTLESAYGASPLIKVPKGEGYDAKFNEIHLQAHNTYRMNHQACPMKFSADAARGA